MADQKISLTISGKDELTPAATTAASSIKKVGDHADEARHKVKSFGEQMNDLRPKGETLAVGMQAVALAVGTVAGVFYKAAGASEALGGKMKEAGDAANSSLGALGDAIAKSGAFNAAMDGIIRGMGDFTDAIGKNQKAVDDLIRAGIDPLTIAFKGVTKIVGGLAMVGLLASETLGPIGNLLVGIQRQSMAVFEFIYKSWANLAAFMTNSDKPFPDFDPLAGGKQAYEGAKGLYGLASGDAHLEQRLNRIINTMEMTEAAADAARDAALGAGSVAGSGRSAPMRSGEVWPFDEEQSVLPREGARTTGAGAARRAAAKPINPYSFRGAEPNMGDVYAAEQARQQAASMASARANARAGEQYQKGVWGAASAQSGAYAQQIAEAQAAQEQVNQIMVASANTLASTFLDLAFAGASASEMMRGLAQSGFSAAASAAGSLLPGWQGQAISAGIGLVGGLFSAMTAGPARRQREYTAQDPLPVKVVNREELQQVTVYNLTVAGSGQSALMQQQQLGRSVSRALNAARRSGAARLAPAGA